MKITGQGMPHKEKIALFAAAFWQNGNRYPIQRKRDTVDIISITAPAGRK